MLVLVEVDDRVATVTLNRPEARNAISAELHGQLDEAITGLDTRDDVGCIVLTGADPAFCAGMDLKSLATELRAVQKERQRGPARRAGMMPPHDTPVIGAINGADRDRRARTGHVLRLPDRLGAGALRRHARPGRRHARRRHDDPAAATRRGSTGPVA